MSTTEQPPAAISLKRRFHSGGITGRQAIVELARTFPTLRYEFDLTAETWDAEQFDKSVGPQCDGAVCAAQFLLSVWNPGAKRKCGKFDLHRAISCWDSKHRSAFVTWASDPWWP